MFEQQVNKYWKIMVDTIQDRGMIVDIERSDSSVNLKECIKLP
jgi:hypothetical protein